jgi:hypothetical protein
MVSATSKTDHHDITEILLKVALNTIKTKPIFKWTFENTKSRMVANNGYCL